LGAAVDPNELFGDRLRTDPARTRAARAAWVRGGAEACACTSCRAWVAHRDEWLPKELREILDALGLDAAFDSAVRPLEADEGTGFELLYHLVGSLPDEPDGELTAELDGLPDAVLGLLARAGRELAPADWPEGSEVVELSVLLETDEWAEARA
jgi:hypothetical protein